MSAHSKFNVTRSKKSVTDHWTTLELGLQKLFYNNFRDYKEWRAISNIKKYKASMDGYIFNQLNGRTPEICEVYWKGEYVCDVSLMDTPDQALTKINDRLIEMLSSKKGG